MPFVTTFSQALTVKRPVLKLAKACHHRQTRVNFGLSTQLENAMALIFLKQQ